MGWWRPTAKYGKLKWADLVEPAIKLARDGFKITKHLADDLNRNAADFKQRNPGKNYFLKDTPMARRRFAGAGRFG
jgi:gamma-glutamyltranspeptidase/glutathione hydrolase